eukprot:COSAG03_NODE_5611_length_1210_cov_1.056706_1_plen_105_part_00
MSSCQLPKLVRDMPGDKWKCKYTVNGAAHMRRACSRFCAGEPVAIPQMTRRSLTLSPLAGIATSQAMSFRKSRARHVGSAAYLETPPPSRSGPEISGTALYFSL